MSHKEITQTYIELEASDQTLKQQLKDLRQMQHRLRKMSYEDSLTGLPNKRALYEDFNLCIENCKGQKGAIVFLDADNFKLINDSLGHNLGDQFIIKIGERLQSLVGDWAKVYRLGGDEFILLLEGMKDLKQIKEVGRHIIEGFQKGFKIHNMLMHTSISAGICIFPEHGTTIEELMRGADMAMYQAKEEGKAKYVFYHPKMNRDLLERVKIEKSLRSAIKNDEFILYYQPQYNIKTREIVGFEALIRWNSQDLGWVMPYQFIKVAEDSQMIIPIGEWVLNTACAFIKKVHQLGYSDYTMAVNVSLLQVVQEDFVEMVLNTLKKHDLNPQYLELEMTETMLIKNFELIVGKLEALKKWGVKIALDDFGTGYSSLNYLNILPLNTLKIDKSFVDTISSDPDHQGIISTLITLGQKMGLSVLAEGVETEEEYAYLYKYGCNSLQGYLLSKPVPEEDILKLL